MDDARFNDQLGKSNVNMLLQQKVHKLGLIQYLKCIS